MEGEGGEIMIKDQEYLSTSFGTVAFNSYANTAGINLATNTACNDLSSFMFDSGCTLNNKKEIKMANVNARGLYQIILVDPKESKIIFNGYCASNNVEDVLLEVDAGKIIKDSGLQVSEVDKIINFLGKIRKSKKNKEGIVELIEEEK